MAKVAVAARTADFRAHHAVAVVVQIADMVRVHRAVEAGPAGAGIKLCLLVEQGQLAQLALVGAGCLVVQQSAAEWRLGALVEENAAFLRGQFGSPGLLLRLVQWW